jgi:chromosome segregation ATPase
MCNNQTTSFCRIYLDLGAVDDPDDGCSLSSVESADMGDEEDEEEKEGSAESEEKDDNDEAPPENDTVDVICIDDDDDDDDEQNTTAGSSSDKGKSDGSLSHNKYRKMAKKLKSRVKMLESERQRLGETSKTLSEQHGRLKKEIDEAASNVIIIRTGMATVERQVESLSLEITRIRRERDQATSDLFQAKSKAIKLETQMVEFKKQYAVDVQRAHTNSMAEVQTILKANPKLTEANRRLKEELLRKEERIQRLEARFLGGSLHKNNNNTKTVDRDRTEPQDSVKSVHRSSKDTAKLLRDFQEDDDFEKLSARAPPERTKTKVYANAARFSRASAKAAARPPTNVSALDAIDQLQPSSLQTDKNKRPSLEQARKFTNAPARKRSKILLSSAANPRDRPFAPKMGPQHDIRNMMTRR